jgi:hypothetical protein
MSEQPESQDSVDVSGINSADVGEKASEDTKNTRRLVYATWALAIVSFFTLLITAYFMHSELAELARSNELAQRPFANIDQISLHGIAFFYTIGSRPDTGNVDLRLVDQVRIGSDAFKARTQVGYNCVRPETIRNSGSTPLWLKGRLTAILTEQEWDGQYGRSPERLLAGVISRREMERYPNDVVVLPDSSFTTDSTQGIPRTMTVQRFDSLQFQEHRLVLYPYTCIRYEDYTGKEYLAVRMAAIIFNIDTVDSASRIRVDRMADEIYRWDVKPH